jgi:hypothetical protein
MSSIKTCAGCTSPAGPFAATVNNVLVRLCTECAARLLRGESKREVVKATNQSHREAA